MNNLKNNVLLNEEQENSIVSFYLTGGKTVTQTWMAKHFGVSRKTIYRVLKGKGVLLNKDEVTRLQGIAQVMKDFDLTAEKVRSLVKNAEEPNTANIARMLIQFDKQTLMELIYQLVGNHHAIEKAAKEVTDEAA